MLIEQTDRFDNTPLHIAAKNGFKHIVDLLIAHNADVDCCNDEELTPLHLGALCIMLEGDLLGGPPNGPPNT